MATMMTTTFKIGGINTRQITVKEFTEIASFKRKTDNSMEHKINTATNHPIITTDDYQLKTND